MKFWAFIKHYKSKQPLRLLIITTLCVFVAEALIMVVLSTLPQLSILTTIFLDATLIVACVLPVLYLSIFRPLQQSLIKRVKSEEKYRLIFETAANLIISVDFEGTLLDCNNRIEEVLGYRLDEMVGQNMGKIIHPDYHQKAQESLSELITTGIAHNKDYKMIRKDGRLIDVSINSSAITDKQGNYIRSICIIDEITERKQAEFEQAKAREFLQTVIDGIPESLSVINSDHTIALANKTFRKAAGDKDPITNNLKCYQVTHGREIPCDSLEHPCPLTKVFKTGQPTIIEHIHKDSTGKDINVEITAAPIFDENGEVIQIIESCRDITERKLAEKKIRKQHFYLSKAQEIGKIGTWELDLLNNSLFWTDENYKVFGIPIGTELNYKMFLEQVHPDDREHVNREWAVALEGKLYDIEHRLLINNKIKWVRERADIIYNKDGQAVSAIGVTQDITERKQAEKALAESELMFRSSIENASGVPYQLDRVSNQYHFVGTGIEDLVGISQEKFSPATYSKLIKEQIATDPDGQKDHTAYGESFWHGKITQYKADVCIQTSSGVVKWLSDSAVPLRDDSGQIVGSLGILMDITERKRVEETMRKLVETTSAKFGDALFESMATQLSKSLNADYTLIGKLQAPDNTTVKTIAVAVNGKISENFEYELAGTPCENVTNGNVCSFESGVVAKFPEDELLVQMGVEGYIGVPLYDSQGLPMGIIAALFKKPIVHRNFAETILQIFSTRIGSELERGQIESALRESKEKFKTYISHAPDAIFISDGKNRYVDVNKAACEITGYSKVELLNMTISDLVTPQAIKQNMVLLDKVKQTGKFSAETELKIKDGSIIAVSLDAVALSENRFMAFCSDITETKRLQELESRAERLETAGTIAGQVAHDFNNLLAPLIAYPDFIRDELPKNHSCLQYVSQMEKAAQKIADINQDLLAMGRRGHYNHEILNINSIVQQAVMEIDPLPQTLTCEQNLSEDLMDISGGGAQIHRVISNILHNAQDAMQNIGNINIKTENFYVEDVSVQYGHVPKGEYVKLTISDTGCGIPDDIAHKIFDPFFTSKTTDKKRGSGLGMSVVDAVIKDHKGYIDFSSKVGEGTSFYIYFPITRNSKNDQQSIDIYGGNESILIVDDDEIQRHVSAQILKKLGYQITSVDSGEKSVALIGEKSFDLLVLDMIMPNGIDGAETYRRIIQKAPHQKAIIVSGFSESDRVIKAQKLGVGVFVQKPLTKEAIAAAVRSELDRKEKIPVS